MSRPITPEKRERILKLHDSNPDLTRSTIGLRCDVSTESARRTIEEAEARLRVSVSKKKKGPAATKRERIKAMHQELILRLSDLDLISIECKSCKTRVLVSLHSEKTASIPGRCPSCTDEWDEVRQAVENYVTTLKNLEKYQDKYKVTFQVPAPAPKGA